MTSDLIKDMLRAYLDDDMLQKKQICFTGLCNLCLTYFVDQSNQGPETCHSHGLKAFFAFQLFSPQPTHPAAD